METLLDAPVNRSVIIERSFRASPAQVYAASTDPEALHRWFGPDGFTCRTHRIDLRERGEWMFDMVGQGMSFPNRHRWTELRPPSLIRFLMDDGEVSGPPTEIVGRLDPEGTATRLRQAIVFPSAQKLEEARGFHFELRAQETLAKLAATLGE